MQTEPIGKIINEKKDKDLKSKKSKMLLQKISIMKSGHFIITYLAQIKEIQKFKFWKFLDL